MEAQTFFYLIIAILVLSFLLEQFLDYLNLKHMKEELPPELQGIYPAEEYRRSIAYQKERQRFSFLVSTLSFGVLLLMLLSGGFGLLDSWLRQYLENPIWLVLAFFGILFLVSDLLSLPFQLYSTFVIEEKLIYVPETFADDELYSFVCFSFLQNNFISITGGSVNLRPKLLHLQKNLKVHFDSY